MKYQITYNNKIALFHIILYKISLNEEEPWLGLKLEL